MIRAFYENLRRIVTSRVLVSDGSHLRSSSYVLIVNVACKTKMLDAQSNQLQQNNTVYYQEIANTPSSESPHQQPAVDLRYIEVGDGLAGEGNQLNGLGTLGGLGLNLPVNFQECEVESNELDQYLPPQTAPIHQYPPVQVTTASQWLLNR